MASPLRSEETSPLAIPDRMDETLNWVDGLLKQLETSQATESLAGLLPVDVPSSEKRQAGRRFAASLSHHYLIPLFDPPAHAPLPIDPAVARQLGATFCRQNRIAPLATEAGSLEVAIASPEAFALVDEIEAQSGRRFCPLFATEAVIDRLLETLYPAEPTAPANASPAAPKSTTSVGGVARGSCDDRSDMRSLGELLAVARREEAASIHFERVGAKTELRLRCEGQLRPCRRWPSAQLGRLLDALKRHAKLAAGEHRRGRSGSLPVRERGHRQSWPVEAIDTVQGERVLVELPTSCEAAEPVDTLRLTSFEWRRLRGWLSPAPGLLLVGGPEEATRVATLTRLAEEIGLRDRSAIFLTRRPECSVPGLHSIQIEEAAWNAEVPMAWFRELPQQDLDLLLLEDLATPAALDSALQLASRGTLVIAGCAAANPRTLARRLREWEAARPYKDGPQGREPDGDAGFSASLAGSLHGLLFQRSVRNLCQYCSEPMPLAEDSRDHYGLPIEDAIYQPRGCIGCEERGYLGRSVLSELWGPAWLLDRHAARARLSPAAIRQLVAGTLSLADAKRFCGVLNPTPVWGIPPEAGSAQSAKTIPGLPPLPIR